MGKCMTANEIADGLAQMHIEKDVNGLFNKRIQNMLRQQQAEIDNLAIVKYLNGVTISKLYAEIEALKAHPVKELTDEEILQVHSQMMEDGKGQLPPYVDFARAILRKAHGQ